MQGIGKRIAAVRGTKSQAEFAREFGLAPSRISDWEREHVDPPLEFLARIALKFSIDLNWLITGNPAADAVRQGNAGYHVKPDVNRIAARLAQHPLLLKLVVRALDADDKLPQLAHEMAAALGIPEEEAYLKLLQMKKDAA